jgi:hypothetical protein
VYTQKIPADFGQGVATQKWQSPFKQRERSTSRLVLSQRARFKETYSALHEFEIAPLFLDARALIKLV